MTEQKHDIRCEKIVFLCSAAGCKKSFQAATEGSWRAAWQEAKVAGWTRTTFTALGMDGMRYICPKHSKPLPNKRYPFYEPKP